MRGKPRNAFGKLAAETAEYFVKHGEYLPLNSFFPPELMRQRACYVSIFERPGKRLRWFFGQAMPSQPTLAQEIVCNTAAAISQAGSSRINRATLPHLQYTVAVVGPLQRVGGVAHLDPQNFGLYLTSDRGKSALILPQRAGIETADDQLATAMREAGINPRAEAITMYRFDVEHYDE